MSNMNTSNHCDGSNRRRLVVTDAKSRQGVCACVHVPPPSSAAVVKTL